MLCNAIGQRALAEFKRLKPFILLIKRLNKRFFSMKEICLFTCVSMEGELQEFLGSLLDSCLWSELLLSTLKNADIPANLQYLQKKVKKLILLLNLFTVFLAF